MDKHLRHSGFSIVELIVAVAIMVVLVGLLTPAFLHYIEKTRAGVDENTAEEIRRATETIILSGGYEVTDDVVVTFSKSGIQIVTSDSYASALEKELKDLFPDFPSVVPMSKKYKDAVYSVSLSEETMDSTEVLGSWDTK